MLALLNRVPFGKFNRAGLCLPAIALAQATQAGMLDENMNLILFSLSSNQHLYAKGNVNILTPATRPSSAVACYGGWIGFPVTGQEGGASLADWKCYRRHE